MKDNNKLIRYLAAFCILFILGSDGALGQGLARISGSVTDDRCRHPRGNGMATRLSTGEKSTASSNGEGGYVFPSLAPAEYVGVTASGFCHFSAERVSCCRQIRRSR